MSAEDKTPIADEYVLITADKCTMENGYLTVTVPVVANKVYQLSIDEGMAGGKLRIVFIGVPEGQVEISPVWDGKSNTFFVKTRKLRPDMVQPPPQRWIQ